jgi:hypothetical protein
MMELLEWPMLFYGSFGNVFTNGRWDIDACNLICDAINSGEKSDWEFVEIWAAEEPWDQSTAC